MQLDHTFTVPAGPDDAWKLFHDLARVAPCMPGAVLDTLDGDSFTGRVKVKIGAVQMSYRGEGTVTRDETARSMHLDLSGSETRGAGTASATVTAPLAEGPEGTRVRVRTDLDITGRPAQFGRGIMTEVGDRLVPQFADRLEDLLRAPPDPRTRRRSCPRPSRRPWTWARRPCPCCSGRPPYPRLPCCSPSCWSGR
ncbi:SRPBCC family protein [Streptomyces sp. NBC_01166]|uniref:SRPBCC family protein n=1 Tax=Streptomyces sp. NBC_01166 TaxID=2903755 RepID=UPI00386BCAE0|nr:SRPBCC family protein [Streptomyces sp. NBC_01166]